MSIAICDFREEHIDAVGQFNERLRAGGETSQFPLSPVPRWLPKVAGRKLFQEYYLAVDDSAAVRGAYILKSQDFWINGQAIPIADFHLPISEGTVDARYPQVAVQLLRDALERQPLLFGLGMGGRDEAIARLLAAAGWSSFSVPFFFRVIHPGVFLRNLACLRKSRVRQWALDALAATGLGWLGIRGAQAFCGRRARLGPEIGVEAVDEFSAWADELWQRCRDQYGMSAVRDAETLRILYPKDNARFIRLTVADGSRPIGWAVLLDTPLSNHRQFGNLRLGSIVDAFASTADAATVVSAAAAHLGARGVDLIVSNHSHAAWCGGFRKAGFLQGPSNFIFASSPQLTALLRRNDVQHDQLHLNRGDGDGPINL